MIEQVNFERSLKKRERAAMKEDIFMQTAVLFSRLSTCARLSVGGVLVKNERIVSTGYNGTPSGIIHCKDYFLGVSYEELQEKHADFSHRYELHCEQNILMECLKNQVTTKGAVLYITISPCSYCAKLLIAADIKGVFYLDEYDRDITGIKLLEECGIFCKKYTLYKGENVE